MYQVDHFIDESLSTVKSLNDGWFTACRTVATIVSHRSDLRVASRSYAEICAIVRTSRRHCGHTPNLHQRPRALHTFAYTCRTTSIVSIHI
jgi:hypothetical protein